MTSTARSPWPRRCRRRAWAGASRSARCGGSCAERLRDEWGRVLAILIGFLGDFDLAEEAVQEAFLAAAERWPGEGEPANRARGW